MTERNKKFSIDHGKKTLKPVSFDLDDERFTCLSKLAGSTILDFVAATGEGDTATAGRLLWLIQRSMSEEEYTRFREYVDDPEHDVNIELLGEVVAYLVEEYTNRPTGRSSSSASGA